MPCSTANRQYQLRWNSSLNASNRPNQKSILIPVFYNSCSQSRLPVPVDAGPEVAAEVMRCALNVYHANLISEPKRLLPQQSVQSLYEACRGLRCPKCLEEPAAADVGLRCVNRNQGCERIWCKGQQPTVPILTCAQGACQLDSQRQKPTRMSVRCALRAWSAERSSALVTACTHAAGLAMAAARSIT